MENLQTQNDFFPAKLDRRKTSRQGPKSGATLAYDRKLYLVGKIISISETGLSFEYPGPAPRTPAALQLDILNALTFLPHLTKIDCRTVYDITGLAEQQSFSGVAVRRCGVEFVNLDEEQRSDLYQLIDV